MLSMHEPFIAWRYAIFVPGFMHILGGIMILFFSTDLPDGNYAVLKKAGVMTSENPYNVMLNALTNYRHGTHYMHICLLEYRLQSMSLACFHFLFPLCFHLVCGGAMRFQARALRATSVKSSLDFGRIYSQYEQRRMYSVHSLNSAAGCGALRSCMASALALS